MRPRRRRIVFRNTSVSRNTSISFFHITDFWIFISYILLCFFAFFSFFFFSLLRWRDELWRYLIRRGILFRVRQEPETSFAFFGHVWFSGRAPQTFLAALNLGGVGGVASLEFRLDSRDIRRTQAFYVISRDFKKAKERREQHEKQRWWWTA